ncbi:hypothetical protein SAMD00023353_4200840 [Rosellinia necatrix]|uniref:Uncharacterized protein n=1 Tax=Rosellinia necatrix TaxID=77044 RepID=A0A1S8A9F0_ROSNE|nr:hypothetical protein SAMD00023353_4200840 [Rosellinia necatrix]
MANVENTSQKYDPSEAGAQSQGQVEEDIYDLDDPNMIPKLAAKILDGSARVGGEVTCRFSAIPLNGPDAFSHDIAQYGDIAVENKDRLIIKVPPRNLNLLDHIRQVWVSKYLTALTECKITVGTPNESDGNTTLVIIQCVLLPKTANTGRADTPPASNAAAQGPATMAGDSPAVDEEQTAAAPGGNRRPVCGCLE